MGRPVVIEFNSTRNGFITLPSSVHSTLLQRGVSPQSLIVELTYNNNQRAYVGWNGLPSQVRIGGDRIEIDPIYAAMCSNGQLVQGMTVSIELLRDLPSATSVNLTPLTADDWEILETNAEYVETHFLSQVRAVREGMVLGCWVNNATLVRFLVDSTIPAASPALLLNSNTELIVAPQSRHPLPSSSSPSTSTTKSHDLSTPKSNANGNTSSSSSSSAAHIYSSSEFEAIKRRLLRLLPVGYSLSPSSLSGSNRQLAIEDTSLPAAGPPILYVSPSLFRSLKPLLSTSSLTCTLSHYPRPVPKPPTASIATNPDPSLPSNPENSAQVSNGVTNSVPTAAESESRITGGGVVVKIGESRRIGEGECWISVEGRKELGLSGMGTKGGEEGIELLKLGNPLTALAKKLRAKDLLEKEKEQEEKLNGTSSRPSLSARLQSSSSRTADQSVVVSSGLSSASSVTPMAGVEDKLELIRKHVMVGLAIKKLEVLSGARMMAASGMLVTGSSGAGKTSLVKQIARELSIDPRTLTHTQYIDCSKFADERIGVMKMKMKDWFDEACWHAPTLLVLDNLDRMLGAEVEHADSFPTLHLAHSFLAAAMPALTSRPIILLTTAQSSAALHPLLSTTHLLGETVALRGPGKTGRRDILSTLVKSKCLNTNLIATTLDHATIAAQTEGYLPADLRDLVDRAIHQAAIRAAGSDSGAAEGSQSLHLTQADFNSAQIGFVPLSLRDVKLQKSEVQWADIGGLHETRRVLRETLEWPTKYGAIFANCPLRLRSGLLLYGFPGCGKTLLASAVAKECGLNFISVKGPEILNKYIGASEKSVRDLFERAQAAKPCILFFDEFDSIAPKRGHDSTGVTDRVVNQMLTQMDGAEGLDGVYVLAATSRPDLIDPALLRPGRLDKSLLCDMPSYSDRLEIMEACSRKIALAPSVDLMAYAKQTQGYSGADLQALIYNAHLDAIHAALSATTLQDETTAKGKQVEKELAYTSFGGTEEDEKVLSRAEQAAVTKRLELIMATLASKKAQKTTQSTSTPVVRPVTMVEEHHLQASLKATRPSVPAEELVRLNKIYSEFVSGRSATGLPSGEASDEIGGRSSLM